jgi:hypothetical protein
VVTTDPVESVLTAYTYQMDGVGNRTLQTEYSGKAVQYLYNQRNELIQEGQVTSSISWHSFTLDEWQDFTLAQWDAFLLNDVPDTAITYTTSAARRRTACGTSCPCICWPTTCCVA